MTTNSAILQANKVIQPKRELPVKYDTDILVVGGGPAGIAATVAACRLGARVALVERYGCFGGLFTGGLVLLLQGTFVTRPNGEITQIAKGFNDDVIRRLASIGGLDATLDQKKDPNADPEAAKYVLSELIRESGARVFLHSWCVDVITDGNRIRGAVLESKSGRQAILAKVIVDASGDGDVFAAAGAPYTQHARPISLVHRVGNLQHGRINTPIPGTSWINMPGEEADGLDVDVLTRLEMQYRKTIWDSVQTLKKTPGNEKAFLMDVASQLGVRITRILQGMTSIQWDVAIQNNPYEDAIGVASLWAGNRDQIHIPYRALLPERVEGIIAAGRCISMDLQAAEIARLIPACFTTGLAAGSAAALALKHNCELRNINIRQLQQTLQEQGAYIPSAS